MTSWMKRVAQGAWVSLAILMCVSGAWAQDQPPPTDNSAPKPAAHAPIIDTNQEPETVTDPNALQPDTTPLTGIQGPGIGAVDFRHSYWVPGFQVANTAQSNGISNWSDTTYLAGTVSLYQAWAHSKLALNYTGGGYFSTSGGQGNGAYQELGFTQSFEWRRFQLQLIDQFSYLPTTGFGFGGLSNLGLPGVGGSLAPGVVTPSGTFLPGQNNLIATGPQYSNSFAAQATYQLTQRGSITAVGSYGILRFIDPGNIDTDDAVGSIGYNYQLTKKDSLGVLYRFAGYRFSGSSQAINDHNFNLAYGRKITGRLGLSIFAGPEFTTFREPIGDKTSQTNVSAGASVTYGLENGGLTAAYSHGANGGSGVLAGAYGDNFTLSGSRQITRQWAARANMGYGRSHAFEPNGVIGPIYNSYYFGAGLQRPIGRNSLLSFGYTAYIENTNSAACGGACSGGTSVQHQFAVGYQWHTRPFVLH
jgi:hypothetical protein